VPGRWLFRATIPGSPQSSTSAAVVIEAPEEPEPVATPARTRRSPDEPGHWPAIVLWSGVGLTAALLIAGITTGQVASNQSAEFRDPATTPSRRRSLDDSAGALSAACIATLAMGAAVGLGTALYYWLGYRTREGPGAAAMAAPLPRGGAYLGLKASF
jgi:hypothetical protein